MGLAPDLVAAGWGSSVRRACVLCFMLVASLALAAEPPIAGPDALERAEADAPAKLDPVVVEARRRAEDPAAVPASIIVISGEELREMGASNFLDYANTVPGLYFGDMLGCCGQKHVLRGINSNLLGEENSATQFYLGDTPLGGHLPRAALGFPPDPQLIDIDRIEVLRGPQGTLFGASAMGGLIRVVPNAPNLDGHEAWVGASTTWQQHGGTGHQLEAVANLPSADGRSALRLAAFQRRGSGWVDNVALGQDDVNTDDTIGVRVATRFEDGAWRIDGLLTYQRDTKDGHRTEELSLPAYQQARLFAEPVADEWSLVSLGVEHRGDSVLFVSTTSFHTRALDLQADYSPFIFDIAPSVGFVPVPGYVVGVDDKHEFTQEFRWASIESERVSWATGVFYQRSERPLVEDAYAPGFDALNISGTFPSGPAAFFGLPDQLRHGSGHIEHIEYAGFGDIAYTSGAFEFGVGARWFHLAQDLQAEFQGLEFGGTFVQESGTSDDGWTPRISGQWKVSAAHSIYATIAEGFRPGGVNATAPITGNGNCMGQLASEGYAGGPPAFYRSDSLTSREAGAKTKWLDERLLINLAMFDVAWRDMQTVHHLDCGREFLENIGDARSRGGELDLVGYPASTVRLELNAAYTDARFIEDAPFFGAQAGDRVAGVPYYTAAFASTWYYSTSSSMRFDYRRVGEALNPYDTFGATSVEAYGYANFMLIHGFGQWQASAQLTNLTDESAVVARSLFFGEQWVSRLPPRAFTLGLRIAF